LIWNIPERKVFIDGRMPSWKWNAGLPGQSNYVMEEYLNIMRGKEDYKPYFEKYNITYVLWPSKKPKSFFDALEEKFGEKLGPFYTILKIDKKDFFLPEKLESDGWTRVYEDDVSFIYKM